jgi:hypothetical protein
MSVLSPGGEARFVTGVRSGLEIPLVTELTFDRVTDLFVFTRWSGGELTLTEVVNVPIIFVVDDFETGSALTPSKTNKSTGIGYINNL